MKIAAKRCFGFTLVELMLSVGCGSLVLAAVVLAGICLQRSFAAVEGYSIAEGDQLRVLDYIALDCRRATTASVANNVLTLTVPTYYDSSNNNVAVNPTINSSGAIQYGSGSVTIAYSQSGSDFVRSVTIGGTTTTTAIAKNVSSFTVTATDLTSSVSCYITFSPRFVYLPGPGPIAGTTVYCNTFLRNAGARM
jgi:Tfp pilus assembly protein PilW